jgi:hypothetical protein
LGLHWRNVDFDNEVIHVRTALNRKATGRPTEDATRSAGRHSHAFAGGGAPPSQDGDELQPTRRLRVHDPNRDATPCTAHRPTSFEARSGESRAPAGPVARPSAHLRQSPHRRRGEHHLRLTPTRPHLKPDHPGRLRPSPRP